MIIGTLKLDLYLPGHGSLKEKRMIVKSLKDRIRKNFNVSIAEIGSQDKWQRSLIGISVIGVERHFVETVLSKVITFIEGIKAVEIIESDIEIL